MRWAALGSLGEKRALSAASASLSRFCSCPLEGPRTSVFVPEWHKLYVAVPRDKERGAELRVFDVVP